MFILIMLLFLAPLTDAEALNRARWVWGDQAFVRHVGVNYQVGCIQNNQHVIVGQSKESYDKAFEKVNLLVNGPRSVSADARDEAHNVGTAPTKVVHICNTTVIYK